MGKVVVRMLNLCGGGESAQRFIKLMVLLMALCVTNNGEINKRNRQLIVGLPLASPLKQIEDHHDHGGHSGPGSLTTTLLLNGGKPGIESFGNVTVLAGQRGELKCRTFNLANYTVLWLRHRDTHLLSAGLVAYTADARFRAFQAGSTWGLRISSTRPSDGGVYECQISTTPPISAFTYLTVVEPVTHIEGLNRDGRGSELFIKAGSTINLTCIVEDATDNAPKHILWRHNSRVVNFEWPRGGLSLVTEKKSRGVTVSRLLIQKAVRTDSGTYQCTPLNAHPAYVKIHVLEQGENQAAMQSASSSSQRTYFLPMILIFLHFLLTRTTMDVDIDVDVDSLENSRTRKSPVSSFLSITKLNPSNFQNAKLPQKSGFLPFCSWTNKIKI